MRTLVAADEPKRPAVAAGSSTTSNTADAVITWISSTGVTVTPWQAVVIHSTYATPRLNARLPHRPLR